MLLEHGELSLGFRGGLRVVGDAHEREHFRQLRAPGEGQAVDGEGHGHDVRDDSQERAPRRPVVAYRPAHREGRDRDEERSEQREAQNEAVGPHGPVDGHGVDRGHHGEVGEGDVCGLEEEMDAGSAENRQRARHGVRAPKGHGDGVGQPDEKAGKPAEPLALYRKLGEGNEEGSWLEPEKESDE